MTKHKQVLKHIMDEEGQNWRAICTLIQDRARWQIWWHVSDENYMLTSHNIRGQVLDQIHPEELANIINSNNFR